METTKKYPLIALFSAVLLLTTACSQPTAVVRPDKPTTHRFNVVEYYVLPGDSLAKISKKLSGTTEHWVKIANFNGIDNPKKLLPGTPLLVPAHLVTRNKAIYTVSSMTLHLGTEHRNERNPDTVYADASARAEKPVSKNTAARPTRQSTASSAKTRKIFQPESLPGSQQVAVNTKQVNVNRTFNIVRLEAGNLNAAQTKSNSGKSIRVVGTYYPKGIYSEPQVASSLLKRVSPGTIFPYVETVGDWVKISTDTGIGYIRTIDAQIIGLKDASGPLLTTAL